jgi:hypothetical protein
MRQTAWIWGVGFALTAANLSWAQQQDDDGLKWRSPDGAPTQPRNLPEGSSGEPLEPLEGRVRPVVARVSQGDGTLPNKDGQVYREYDISPYTTSVTSTSRPEQTILDWILRETGIETWHGETVAMLSADGRTLRVYHTPEIQDRVARTIDRFVTRNNAEKRFAVDVIAIASPDWRTRLASILRPSNSETPGLQTWILTQQNAAILAAELTRRTDYRPISTPGLTVLNGQDVHVLATRPRRFVQSVSWEQAAAPAQPASAQVSEGFGMEMVGLLSQDGTTAEAVIRSTIDRVEKVHAVEVDSNLPVGNRGRLQVEVPQQIQYRLHEQFRWPADQVLVISTGMVPAPLPQDNAGLLAGWFEDQRAEVLIILRLASTTGIDVVTPRPNAIPQQSTLPAAPTVPDVRY